MDGLQGGVGVVLDFGMEEGDGNRGRWESNCLDSRLIADTARCDKVHSCLEMESEAPMSMSVEFRLYGVTFLHGWVKAGESTDTPWPMAGGLPSRRGSNALMHELHSGACAWHVCR